MATQVAIAKMREEAMLRLKEAMTAIGQSTNVEPAVLPLHNRDAGYLQAEQLSTIANWLDSVAQVQSDKATTITDEAFGIALRDRMKEAGIEVGKSLKADLEAFLELHAAADEPEIVLPPEEYEEGEIPEPLVPYVSVEDDDGDAG